MKHHSIKIKSVVVHLFFLCSHVSFAMPAMDLYLGLDAGYVQVLPKKEDIESKKEGYSYSGQALINLFTDRLSLDLGVGWMQSSVRGNPPNVPDEETRKDRQKIDLQLGLIDIAASAIIKEKNEIGLNSRIFFGSDGKYSPFVAEKEENQVHIGMHYLRRYDQEKSFVMRYGAKILTDLTEADRQVLSFLGVIQFGFNVKEKTENKDKPQVLYKPEPSENKYLFVLDSYVVNFETRQASLKTTSERFLQELAYLLQRNKDKWTSIEIEGHTDITGGFDFNQTLSLQRATSAKNVFVRGGIPESKISVKGFGASVPIDPSKSSVAFARNRRVEIGLIGLTDQVLIKEMNDLKRRLSTPINCNESECN